MRLPVTKSLGLFLLLASFAHPAAAGAPEPPKVPAGFHASLAAEGLDATALAVAPDGRVFIAEKHGVVRVLERDRLLAQPAVTLKNVETDDEQGLDGIALHPDFAKNGWLYLFYTVRGPENRGEGKLGRSNRISRFAINERNRAGEESVIFETDRAEHIHNGGAMCFGPDGKLYVGSGEVTLNDGAQRLTTVQGKVLRLNDDGSIPADNPLIKQTQGKNQAIYAYGFRQPFKGSFQPGTGRFYLNVVSTTAKEAIFEIKPGVNGGWPMSEGYTDDSRFVNPIFAYGGIGGCITGGAFCNTPQTQFPKRYQGLYFFMDYMSNWIRTLDPADPQKTVHLFASNLDRPVDLAFAPDGSLYCLNRGNGNGNTVSEKGTLWHIRCEEDVPASQLAFLDGPRDSFPGALQPRTVTVGLQDAKGRLLPFADGRIQLALHRNGRSYPYKTVATVDGVASFPDLTIAWAGKGYTLIATREGLPPVTSEPFEILAKVARPVIRPSSNKFTGPVTALVSSPTANAEIRYTLDGSAPNKKSALYTGPLEFKASAKLRVQAFRAGLADSQDESVEYAIRAEKPFGLPYREPLHGLKLPSSSQEQPPATLSATGVFADLAKLRPRAGFVPYDVIQPLWSDGAEKQRWIGLPGDRRIRFSDNWAWAFPAGTVLVKNFSLAQAAGAPRRLETRLLIIDDSENGSFGFTYRWRSDQSDADLVAEAGRDETLSVASGEGTRHDQVWHYPGRSECLSCHRSDAGRALGVNQRQLNRSYEYPGTQRIDNQIRTWSYLQMFDGAPREDELSKFAKLVALSDKSAPLELRIRSYMDVNCAQCHRPGGTSANFDARFETPLERADIVHSPVRNELNIPGSQVVRPRDLTHSMLYRRLTSQMPTQRMPPLARNVLDPLAVDAFAEWIGAMDDKGRTPNR
ncbi:MAG TPA: PQQ-dependent sugar dehydrogenase [Pirellulales bacterium]|nr:PQQ-dependent sugar dehydrogenase [Pirellulales bacterium]